MMRFRQVSESVWAGFGEHERNAGFVRGDGVGGLLVGTPDSEHATARFLAAAKSTAKLVVLLDAGGQVHVPDSAELVMSDGTAAELAGRTVLDDILADPGSSLSAYLAKPLYTHGVPVRRMTPDHIFTHKLQFRLGQQSVVVLDIGPGYSDADTVVWLQQESVLITGGTVSNGVHPAAWSGSMESWRAACVQLAALRPVVVVPGYGPVTDITGIIDFRDYLDHLRGEAEVRYRRGMPVEEAAADLPLGRWAHWACRENLAITLTTIYRELGAATRSVTDTLTTAAELAEGVRRRPRIAPLAPGDRDRETEDVLKLTNGDNSIFDLHSADIPNIISTLVRHPKLYEQTVPIARGIVTGVLPARHRELVILRGAWVCSAPYQWNHHHHLALAAGLTEREIDLISHDVAIGDWTLHERAVLTAVDELHANSVVSEETWAILAETYDQRELIELVTLIGEYHKISFQLNSWGVPLEPWIGPYNLPSGWRTPVPFHEQVTQTSPPPRFGVLYGVPNETSNQRHAG